MEIKDFKKFTALTPEQKENRNKGIGGSDAAAVLGLSRWKTPLDVYQDKMGCSEPFNGNLSTALGDYLETFIMEMYANQKDIELEKPDSITEMVHRDYAWMRCNLDFMSKDRRIVGEIKYTSNAKGWGDEGTDEMPTEYLIQCAHNCIIAESFFGVKYDKFPCVVLIQGFGGPQIKEYFYKRNPKLEALIIKKEKAFWLEHVEKETPPNASNLKENNIPVDQIIDEAVIADEMTLDLYEQHKTINAEIKSLKSQDEMVKYQISQSLNEKTTLVNMDGERLVTWNPQTANKFDRLRFKNDNPELYLSYVIQSYSRPMRFHNG